MKSRALLLAGFVGLLWAAAAGLAEILTSFDHNESMYLTAGFLVSRGQRLYQDFGFWQMPYSALLYALLFKLTGTGQFLLFGKLLSFVAWLGGALVCGLCLARVGAPAWLSLAGSGVFLLEPTILGAAHEASNYILPVPWALLAVGAAAEARQGRRPRIGAAVTGLALGMATGFKLYYAPLLLPLVLLLGRRGAWCVLGFGVALLPALGFALADPEAFVFNNYTAHSLTARWWAEPARALAVPGLRLRLSALDKVAATLGDLARPGGVALFVALAIALVFAGRPRPCLGIGLVCGLLAWPCAWLPTPMWPQYLALPMPWLVLVLGYALLGLTRSRPRLAGALLVLVLALQLVDARTRLLTVGRMLTPEEWTPTRIHRLSRLIPPALGESDGRLAALQGLFAIESGLEPYPELAAAPFSFVLADTLPPESRRRYRLYGPQELGALLAAVPPAAVLTGLYPMSYWSDQSLDAWCRDHGYLKVETFPWLNLYRPGSGG